MKVLKHSILVLNSIKKKEHQITKRVCNVCFLNISSICIYLLRNLEKVTRLKKLRKSSIGSMSSKAVLLEKLDMSALQHLVAEMPQYVKKKQLMTDCCANLKGIK